MSNACTRLLDILQKINKYPNNAFSLSRMWTDIFHLEDAPEFELYVKDTEFRKLMYDAKLEAEQFGDKNPWIRHFDHIINIFKEVSLKSGVHEIKKNFDTTLVGIESCAFALKVSSPEPDIDQESLEEFIQELDEVYQLANELNIPSDLKLYILDNVLLTKKAIVDYHINGINDIRKAMESTVGQVLLNHEILNETQKGKDYISKVIGVMSKINTVFSFYNNAHALSSGVTHFLQLIIK
ncbi:hypothetical protein [Paenibacillus sp. URB8-2]|uniref:hypothetical protein n=1 Tax=Paenibacillus sp. URB8-2 TaxID=2741301 RepID=UPI0015BD0A70|nr:hypothetical protein [Paenibacillus sp. URB8-2]BCG56762.1 hypothetical protein PUR_01870 [Paenibacillus sp. URB8-2]